MLPILYDGTSYTDNTFGLGVLSDAISTEVEEERNGIYELTMRYPISGQHYSNIALRRIIKAKPNFTDDPQLFRIYRITKPISGVVTIYARHISSDLSDKLVPVGTNGSSCAAACAALSAIASPFTITTDKSVTGTWRATEPASIRAWFGGRSGSLLDVYGTGEWYYNGTTCQLLLHRGSNRGVVIRYGKNLTELTAESDCTNMASSVLPYYMDTDGNVITGTAVSTGMTAFTREIAVDFSSDFQETPTAAQLTERCQAYVNANNFTAPKGNITLDFVQIGKLKDRVDLCDTVTIEYEALGVSASVQCIRTVWDVLAERYIETEFGDPKESATETIIAAAKAASEAVQVSTMRAAINSATSQITGNDGGYIVWHDSNQDGQPDELLVMDTPSIETAVKVWRFNKNGLGFSATGYDGEYALAMTADGAIVADMITVGTLSATLMRAGILKSLNYDSSGGTAGFSMNLETGEIFAPALVISAKNYTDTEVASALATAAADATSKANAAQTAAKNYTDTQISVIPGQISSAISDIRIGGRNILKNSGTCGSLRLWAGASEHGGTMTIVRNVSVEEWNCDDAVRVYGKSGSTSTLFGLISDVYAASTISIPDEKYVFSIFAKNNGSSNYVVFSPNSLAPNITIQPQETKRIVQVATGNGISALQFAFYTNAIGNNYDITFWHPQIEYGNKVTDWSPAPEDIYADYNYKFNTVEQNISSLNQTAASISSEVSKKVNTTVYNANNQAVSQQISSLSSRIDQTAGSIRGIVSEEISGLEDQAESISNWFDFSVSNFLTIGQAGSAYKTQITNSAFNILHGSSVIGSFSNSGLDTSAITLDTSLSLPPFTLESINNGTEWLLTE